MQSVLLDAAAISGHRGRVANVHALTGAKCLGGPAVTKVALRRLIARRIP
jgi:hypothetical protein